MENKELKEPDYDDPLIVDKEYHCWLEGEYLGIATFREDKNIGASFINMAVNENGELLNCVFLPDRWKLV